MAGVFWRGGKFLNDEELLEAAEVAAAELEQLPLDNNLLTDEENSEDDEPDESNVIRDDIQGMSQQNDLLVENAFETLADEVEFENDVPRNEKSKSPVEEHFLECTTATDYFLKVLGSTTIENIVYQSNLYATQRNKVLNLKENELLAFIGIHFFMGYHHLPSYKHYWSSAEDLDVPIVIRTMPRNRFQQILSFLHMNDNSTIPRGNKGKIYKIRPFVSSLNNQFDLLYHGTRELSVDESIILFKGRSTIKQYNPMKPIKRGYKLWCIADQHGYIKKFDVYQGKDEIAEEKFQSYGLGERVVLSLTENYWGKSRIIYFDNYFSTVQLLEKLKLENTLACGTIRSNRRGLPKDMTVDKNMKRGDYDYRVSNLDIIFFKWCDNRSVYLLSNFHGSQPSHTWRTDCEQLTALTGGLKKWWHRLFFGLLDIVFVNSYVIYKKINPDNNVSLLEFRRGVSTGLMIKSNAKKRTLDISNGSRGAAPSSRSSASSRNNNSVNPPKRRKYNYSVSNDVRLGNRGAHWPIFGKDRRRCEQCSSMGVESRPHSKCSSCGVFLCSNEKKNCFLVYHEFSQ
ncbi:hypothetical protein NQ314_016090 [Rhamnusium bicolor]|uniref:PiggyBac transposable element-derived protein domain-containing protein n=1 Tax=Rhamnusium bicolor TaxID=1586634 RepID=A0AAV8WZL1_9CUCU|nr:hypothetical protein NQ314_016090 [Rhamnusium bicolor]